MRTMDRCQRKPGCENLADRDGCEDTQAVREKQKAKSHVCRWRDKLWGVQATVKQQRLGCSKLRGEGNVSTTGCCYSEVRRMWPFGATLG